MARYRGRLAPSPTGELHLGHAQTFWIAQERARARGGQLVLRIEDLDRARCRPEFYEAIIEDLRWFGFRWDEGPDLGGPFAPYAQSARDYFPVWEKLRAGGFIYPCTCSRRDVRHAPGAPHEHRRGDAEPLYPGTCRNRVGTVTSAATPAGVNWRFRVPEGKILCFHDANRGLQTAAAGRDFGDFVVWRRDDVAAYQLAVVADDAAMGISEVVRGEDLIVSTFRQLLLYEALELEPPAFFHGALRVDENGERLAKRNGAISLRALRAQNFLPEQLRADMT